MAKLGDAMEIEPMSTAWRFLGCTCCQSCVVGTAHVVGLLIQHAKTCDFFSHFTYTEEEEGYGQVTDDTTLLHKFIGMHDATLKMLEDTAPDQERADDCWQWLL